MHREALHPHLRERQQLGRLGAWNLLLQALLVGGIAGGVIGAFRLAYTVIQAFILERFQACDIHEPLAAAAIFGGLLCLGLCGWLLVRHEPLIAGSGIPQVELEVMGRVRMRWGRVLWTKFVATLLSLTGGLSVGREGPCIQMGAAVGRGVGDLFGQEAGTGPRFLVGGSVAGLAAAFGAPAAGMCFAFEEMRTMLTAPMILFTGVAAGAAWFVVQMLFGFGRVFPLVRMELLDLIMWWIPPLMGAVLGGLGALYNALLVGCSVRADRCRFLVPPVRIVCVFLLSGALLYCHPAVITGFGPRVVDLERLTLPLATLLPLLFLKMLHASVSFASGAAGGLLMPMLAVGAIAGGCMADALLDADCIVAGQEGTICALGMAGLFSATVRAPLTGAMLVTEMTGSYANFPAMLAAAYVAVLTANCLESPPVYESLKLRWLEKLQRIYPPPAAKVAQASEGDGAKGKGEAAVTSRPGS
ncbi:MAG: chloride channel protein [Desulfovibrio sp.]|jgi:H+/Cl- antiporter ClcA|nr:chloride channel protein [Desulfovibrio sp.]